MASLEQIGQALKNAHAAGDTEAARKLAAAYQRMRAAPQQPQQELDEAALRAKYGIGAPTEETPEGPSILGELGRGFESTLSSIRTGGSALFGDAEEAALAGLERQRQIAEEYGEGPSFERVKRAYEEDGLLSAAGTALGQLPAALAGQVPQLAQVGLGALAGQAAIPIPLVGAAIGATAASLPMFFGSNVERQAATQQEGGAPIDVSLGKAGAAALGQAGVEAAGTYFTFGKGLVKGFLGIADDTGLDSVAARDLTGAALAKLRGDAGGSRLAAAGRGARTGALAEIPTEVAQQVIERAQAGLDVLSPEALAEYGEAAYMAGTVGGVFGGAARVGDPGRAQDRLRGIAEEEAQDEFTAVRQELENRGQMELGGLEPVRAPTTTAGEAQQEAARQYELGSEEYRTRGGEQRYARPGTLAEPTLPTVVNDLDAFNYMKEQGLTEATALDTLSKADKERLAPIKAQMNETALVEMAAAEAARVPRAPGEAPLVIDTRKSIAEFDPAEREVLDRVVDRLRSKAPAPGTQQKIPKSMLPLVGEEATAAKDKEAKEAQDKADKEAQKAQAAADKEAQRVAAQAQKLNVQRAKTVQDPRRQQALDLGEPVDLAREIAVTEGVDADAEQRDLFGAATKPVARPAPKFPTTQEERTTLAKEIGLSPSLGMVKNKGILAEYATQDLADPVVAARFVADLEIKKKEFKGAYADKNTAAVDTLIARFAPKKEAPAVVDELGGDVIDTTTQRVEETTKDVQVPKATPKPKAEAKPKAEPKPKAAAKPARRKPVPKPISTATYETFWPEGRSETEGIDAFVSELGGNLADPVLQGIRKEAAGKLSPKGKKELAQLIRESGASSGLALENASNSPKLEGDLLDAVTSGNLKKTISLLLDKTAKRPEVQQILKRIQSMGLKTKVVEAPLGRPGEYDPTTDTITLDPELGLNEHTLIHELSHAALAERIADPKSKEAKAFGEFFQIVKNQLGGTYGGTDVQEFAAELMGNEQFAASLKAIKAPKGGNLLQRIVQAIAEFFGFRKGQSAYDAGIKYINELLNVPASAEPTLTEKLFMGTPTSAVDALRQIEKDMPPVTKKALADVEQSTEGLNDALRRGVFSLLRLDNIYQIYKDKGSKYTPFTRALKQLIDFVEKRTGFIESRVSDANTKYIKFRKLVQKYPQQAKRLFEVAEKARIAGIDLLPGAKQTLTPAQQEEASRLKNVLGNMPAPMREMYFTMRRDYDKAFTEYREFMLAQYADNPTTMKEMREKFTAEHPVTGYVPFMRFGDFVLEYTDPASGRRVVQQFETRSERSKAITALKLPAGTYSEYARMDDVAFDRNAVPSSPFLAKVMADLAKQGASDRQLNSVYQVYLSMFPAESIVKRMMKSDNVAGMSDDMVRAYSNTMIQWARHMGNSMYTPQIDDALDSLATYAKANDKDANVKAIVDNLTNKDAREFLHNPTFKEWVSRTTAISYGAFILGNVASAVINLTSLPLLGYPILGGRYGFGAAAPALTNALRIVTPVSMQDMLGAENAWSKLPPKYKKLIEVLNDHGQLQHTQTREILEGRRTKTEEYDSPLAKVMEFGSAPFSATEKVNRAAMAVAAYDLAKAGGNGFKPMSDVDAIEYALSVVKDVNTSGMASTGPALFQSDLGRIFGTFKTFAWNAAFVVAKMFHDSYKGETKDIQRVARRQLLGTMATSAAISGVSGMPFVMQVSSLVAPLLQALFGDDEDEYEYFNTREWMLDFAGELGYKGPLNYFTNLAIAERAAITQNLMFREDPKLIDDVGYVRAGLLQSLGPAAGYAFNISDGVKLMGEGYYERGLEKMLPSALANVLKGFRFLQDESALTKDGKPIMEDVTAYNAVMQAIGFAPADLAITYEERGLAMDVQEYVRKKKAELLDLAWAARQSGDEEAFEEAREKLVALGQRYPGEVDRDTIKRSFRATAANQRDSVSGLTLDKGLLQELLRRFESLED